MTDGREIDGQTVYQIKLQGKLDERWADWFNGMTLVSESGITTLTGVVDQAKLRGILSKIWDLNLTVVSVTQMESEKDSSHVHEGGERNGKTLENGMA
ncbi:MAG: hypothetical protein OEW09_18450 [Anaerolineae bacterium]|nr:hypothetical protein [Anaerolineae bacterium]